MDYQEQIQALRQRIREIMAEGEVAPDNTWIAPFQAGSKRKDGYKYFDYYKLMEATGKRSRTGKIQGKQIAYLGKAGNPKYKCAKAAIGRRNEIQQLESEIKQLEAAAEYVEDSEEEEIDS